MPTRLPYGLSYIKPGAVTDAYTFPGGDTTPDVSLGTVFYAANSTVTITAFDGGEIGKVIYVYNQQTAGAVVINTGGNIALSPYLAANTASGAITASAKNLSMSSAGLYAFLAISSSQWVQLDGNRVV